MSRQPGSDKTQVEGRKREELVSFNLRFSVDELKITRLRMVQAVRRDAGLSDLLVPATEEIDRVLNWLLEAINENEQIHL
jgi:hypothetical protein